MKLRPGAEHVGGPFIREPHMIGVFTREEAAGAIPNGTRIEKVRCEDGDGNPLGAQGTVLGSLPALEEHRALVLDDEIAQHTNFAYFVEWDDHPGYAVGIVGGKIGRVKDGH